MNLRPILSKLLLLAGCAVFILHASAQSTNRAIVLGPFWSGTIRGPGDGTAIAMKGIAIAVGAKRDSYVCYDTDLMRLSMAWTGEFLEFGNTLTRIEWPPPPQVKGTPVFRGPAGPGWARGTDFSDPRPKHQGPLPKDWAHYRGLYINGDNVILSYTVGSASVLELPGLEEADGLKVFTRTLNVPGSKDPLSLSVCEVPGGPGNASLTRRKIRPDINLLVSGPDDRIALGLIGEETGIGTRLDDNHLKITLPARPAPLRVKLAIARIAGDADLTKFEAYLKSATPAADLAAMTHGGPKQWKTATTTRGVRGAADEPYVVDTLTEPVNNPWNAKTFFGGFDFFSDGRAAICTFHGDVWIVSGIDDSLEKLVWTRHATGLFQPLGLKVVDDVVYVLGRDQITRLRDLNSDGEADFYENFNNDTVVTSNYHEFSLDLHTDTEGNFYFAKGAPWEPDVVSPHQGTLIKVSRDGSKMEVIATGFRAPNGMTVGPENQVTVSDNQGHWMPASKVSWIRPGGFYGMTPAAQREMKLSRAGTNFTANPSDPESRSKYGFKGWDGDSPMPEGYDEPFCWLPMNMDNSSGGQVWVTSDQWGPFNHHLLFMSYGKCTLFHVMIDEVDGVRQGGMVQFPLKFFSGVMRGRFNPKDGQLYLCGLKGWQNSAARDGGFYRVRFTGQPVRMAGGLHFTKNGIEIAFTTPLDPKSAEDLQNYSVDQWNYRWSGDYGSPDFSVKNPGEKKRDPVGVKSARLSEDKRTVFLEVPDLAPCDQIRIKLNIDAADGEMVAQEIYGTIHKLGPPKTFGSK